jgi:lambda family phage portal protein
MNFLERTIASVAPKWAAGRAQSRAVLMHYDGAMVGRRTSSLRADRTDADAAAKQRDRLAYFARDMVRNTPFAARAQQVISSNVVGDGIIPKVVVGGSHLEDDTKKALRDEGLRLIEDHFDTTAIDSHGRTNLYGLQRLIMNTVSDAGECLVRIHRLDPSSSLPLPLQLEVMEPDFLDKTKWGWTDGGSEIRDGIEYDAAGSRVAYWIYPEHPGGDWSPGALRGVSDRVPVADLLHIYRQDRPGQQRGVSWFAPVMLRLVDLADHEDAQLMRQKISACFAAFRTLGAEGSGKPIPDTIMPGMIYDLGESEDVKFAVPPAAEGYDEFTRSALRSVAAGLGITYEALTGDLAQVNFSSGRMGRIEMDANISAWQWLMLVPQLLQPLGKEFVEAWASKKDTGLAAVESANLSLTWVPPRRILVDPAREIGALNDAVRSGFASRQQVIRQLGLDPERLLVEIAQDRAEADELGLLFDSDPRADASRQNAQSKMRDKSDE